MWKKVTRLMTHTWKEKKIKAALHPSEVAPNINRELRSASKLPLLALVHTLPEGIERSIRLNLDLHKGWKCFALLANEPTRKIQAT